MPTHKQLSTSPEWDRITAHAYKTAAPAGVSLGRVRVQFVDRWPVDSTLFLVPALALRGFRGQSRSLTLAWLSWRLTARW